jgi:hypothetical protein
MSYNTPNYTEQGGAKTVIGGEIEVTGTIDLTNATVEGVVTAAVIDTLVSTSATDALSANQGKALKALVDAKVPIAAIVNDLTTGGIAVPLSAEQGKTLGARVAANQAANTTTAATDDATVWALANQLKTDVNGILTKLKAAGLMAADA